MSLSKYCKRFLPLESDPAIFTSLAHRLGLSQSVVIEELLEPEDIEHSSILSYILVFPTTDSYENDKAEEEKGADEGLPSSPDVVFFQQTIDNACGLYALLHALCNGRARDYIEPSSFLGSLLQVETQKRQQFLEESKELENMYTEAAREGSTNPEIEPDYHFTSFVQSAALNMLVELDGDRRRPIGRASLESDPRDFNLKAAETIRQYFGREKNGDKAAHFNLLLVKQRDTTRADD